jgi:hypothetical protein
VLNADPLPGTGRSKRIRALSDLELADATTRSVVLMDLAGHAKYLKTTLHGLIGRRPDHCIVCVSATTGLNSITTEHIGVCMYLKVPLMIVITKVDCVNAAAKADASKGKSKHKQRNNSYGAPCETAAAAEPDPVSTADATTSPIGKLVESIQQILAGLQRSAMVVSNEDQLIQLLQTPAETQVVPVFAVSNKTGEGVPLLRSYLFQLPTHAKSRLALQEQSACVRILGAIGNTDSESDRDSDVVYPKDEDLFSLKREVRHSSNRYALNPSPLVKASGGASGGIAFGERSATSSGEKVGASGLRCNSTSEDNLASRLGEVCPGTPCLKESAASSAATARPLPRAYSAPDLPSVAATGYSNRATPTITDREFAEFVDHSASSPLSTPQQQLRKSSPSSSGCGTPQTSRTKVLIGSIESGKVTVGEPMLFGPTSKGEFLSVRLSLLCYLDVCSLR